MSQFHTGLTVTLVLTATALMTACTSWRQYDISVDEVTISFGIKDIETVRIEVYDLHGKVVINESRLLNAGLNKAKLDISMLSNGVYFVRLHTSLKETAKKLVVINGKN